MARSNLKIAVGSYTGNGTANTNINIGFQPRWILIKRAGSTAGATYIHSDMPVGTTAPIVGGAEGVGNFNNITSNGINLNTNANLNANGGIFNYIAITGKPEAVATGSYIGSGADNRNFTDIQKIPFTPGFVFIKGSGATSPAHRSYNFIGDLAASTDLIGEGSDKIQNFQVNGFQLGTSSAVNTAASVYRYLALNTTSEFFCEKRITGNGTSQTVGFPFLPDFILIKGASATARGGLWFRSNPGTVFVADAAADITDGVLGISQNPINSAEWLLSLGANSISNENAVNIRFMAFKAGDFIVPFTRTLV